MADTQRTLSAILALLADNSSGAISPQDIRDTVVTLETDEAELYLSSSAATTVSATSTFYKVAGTTTLETNPAAINFTMPADNRLTFGGDASRTFFVTASVSFTCASNNQVVNFRLGKNGTSISSTQVSRKVGTGADVGAVGVQGLITLAASDYVELFVSNDTSAANVTVTDMNLIAMGAPA